MAFRLFLRVVVPHELAAFKPKQWLFKYVLEKKLNAFQIIPISVIKLLRRSTFVLLKNTFFESFLILLLEKSTRFTLPLIGWKVPLKSAMNMRLVICHIKIEHAS